MVQEVKIEKEDRVELNCFSQWFVIDQEDDEKELD